MPRDGKAFPGRDLTCFLSEVSCLGAQAGFFFREDLHIPLQGIFHILIWPDVRAEASLAVASDTWSSSWPVASWDRRSRIQHGSVTERIHLGFCDPVTLCVRLSRLVVADR